MTRAGAADAARGIGTASRPPQRGLPAPRSGSAMLGPAVGPVLIAVAVAAVFLADTFLPWQAPLSALYVVTVLTAVLFFDRNTVWAVSAACVALDIASLVLTGQSPVLFVPELTAIGVSAYLGLKIKSVEAMA